jgi:hypothetical protein
MSCRMSCRLHEGRERGQGQAGGRAEKVPQTWSVVCEKEARSRQTTRGRHRMVVRRAWGKLWAIPGRGW